MKTNITPACLLCLSLSALACAAQFKTDHLLPLAIGFACALPIWKWRPSWRWVACLVPGLFSTVFLFDAFVFHHRLAVECRVRVEIFNSSSIEDILPSPSGDTTIYMVEDHWIERSYRIYISAHTLFPRCEMILTSLPDLAYPRDIRVDWKGPVFVAGDSLVTLAYDERNAKIYRKERHPFQSAESFSDFVESLIASE
jgi:hypothetical protein